MQEHYIQGVSGVHRIDARVKVIFTLAFIIFLNLTPFNAWPAYILFLTLVLSAAIASRLKAAAVLKRSLLAAPFVLAAAPLVFTLPPTAPAVIFPGFQIPISQEGIGRFSSIAARSWISILAAIVLTATTRFPDLMAAFRQLKVPRIFVAIISLMWRYLFIIADEVADMTRARSGRSSSLPGLRSGGSVVWRARVAGGMAGSLFLRSLERSDRVYAAMLSRGYNGDLPPLETAALPRGERFILLAGLLTLAALWVFSLIL